MPKIADSTTRWTTVNLEDGALHFEVCSRAEPQNSCKFLLRGVKKYTATIMSDAFGLLHFNLTASEIQKLSQVIDQKFNAFTEGVTSELDESAKEFRWCEVGINKDLITFVVHQKRDPGTAIFGFNEEVDSSGDPWYRVSIQISDRGTLSLNLSESEVIELGTAIREHSERKERKSVKTTSASRIKVAKKIATLH